jgi:UDP-N-acetylglucosamine--N-acetylmuramyl-(pentapeptide) pyrophosphoryl-undecaprenol N-acetylglucosamine transferase
VALSQGLRAAWRILKDYQPNAVFFTGGYVAVPMAVAAMFRKIPALLYVPDIEPGLALKTLAHFAQKIAVTTEESIQFFRQNAKILVTGYPVRTEVTNWNKNTGREHLGITSAGLPVLLIFGGSKGAHSINAALIEHLNHLLERVEVIHISGELDWPLAQSARAAISPEKTSRYHAYPYLHEDMGAALAAADLVVSRAGASILGELPLFGLPAILAPYPHAWRYQMVNASILAKRGAALIIEDAKLKSGLVLTIEKLLDTPEKLDEMRKAMLTLRSPNAAEKIAAQLYKLAETQQSGSSQTEELHHDKY